MFGLAVLKYVLIIVVLTGPYVSVFLIYLNPALSSLSLVIGLVGWIPLFFFWLAALFRRRWKTVAILSATWLLAFLPFFGVKEQLIWVRAQGFRIHATPLEDYLSGCTLIEFVENGVTQAVGPCEGSWSGDVDNTVFYDTSGEFVLPVSRRTPEWKKAMEHFTPREVLIESEDRAEHIVGNFYLVSVHVREMTGG